MNNKLVIFILGMHRSGTSAMAGAIHQVGISGGERLLDPAFDNVKGFFENQNAVEINEAILADWGLAWDSPFTLPSNWVSDSSMQKHKNAIRHFLETELATAPAIYVKDPRLCYLLPIWQEVMTTLEIGSKYLITIRRPEEIFHSLKRRNNMGRNQTLSLWLNHLLLAEKHTQKYKRLFVSYDDLLEAPVEVLETVIQELGLMPEGNDSHFIEEKIPAFIDKKLRHHDAQKAGFSMGDVPYCEEVANILPQLLASPYQEDVLARLEEIRKAYLSNLAFFTPGQKAENHATLKVVAGENERMFAPMKITVFPGLEEVVFNLGQMGASQATFHFFPSSDISHLTLHKVSIHYEDGSMDLGPFLKVALLEHGNEFIFGKEDHLIIEPAIDKKALRISIELKYHSFGEAAFGGIHSIGENSKVWFRDKLQEKEEAIDKANKAINEWNERLVYANYQMEAVKKEAATAEQEFFQHRESLRKEIKRLVAEQEKISQTHKEELNQLLGEQEKLTQTLRSTAATAAQLKTQAEVYRQKIKEKDNLIWDIYSKNQKLERDYQQSLATLEDVKASMSYRIGWILTAPVRFVYDIVSKKPINETSLWLFFQFLATGLRMPGRMLSQINAANIKTLRKALANESPSEIVGNLKKLLTGKQNDTTPDYIGHSSPETPSVSNANFNGQAEGTTEIADIHLSEKPPVQKSDNGQEQRKTVLFASPYLPDFDGSSGGKRATRMLGLLAEECAVYAFTLGDKPGKHVKKLEELGVRVFQTTDFQEVAQLVPTVDVLIFSFFYTYFDCGKFLSLYPNAKVIVDSVDVHWVRHERSKGLWKELTDDIIQKKKVLEIDVYKKADIVWAVTEQDRQAVLEEVPGADVRIVSNVHSLEASNYQDPNNQRLLFFGGFAHYPNIIAVKELVFNVFPKIREQVPDATLLIAGSNAPPDIVDLGRLPNVEFLGFIEDGQLSELYKNSFLALAPLQTGAGIKGKICEAIAFRLPVVTNSIGNEGIGLVNEESGLVADDAQELVRLTVKALRREYDLEKMTHLAQSRLQDLVGPANVKRNMLASLSSDEVSICIVTWNKLGLLQRCIESIETHTSGIRYKILVWSNGCSDGTQQYLEAAAKINPNIVPILSKTNEVFVIPNNRMMQMFPANDVVLLNNDTYVTGDWLTSLRKAAYSSEDIGITGAKLLYPDGRLQEFGSELYADGTGRNIGKGDDPDKPEYGQPKFAGYASGCVFYVKRQTIKQIGVFDEAFHPCYCEDSDYCYTAWEHGIATLVTPDCVVYHDEGSTSGTDTSTGFKAYQKVNFEKFLRKHGGRLEETGTKIKLKNLSLSTEKVSKYIYFP